MLIQTVNNAERAQGFKDLSLALRDGGAEKVFRVWRVSAEWLSRLSLIESATERVKTVCLRATHLDVADFEKLHSSAWPTIYFAAFGLISAEKETAAIMSAREIGLDLIVENLPGAATANLENN
jgi:hypothetical protein